MYGVLTPALQVNQLAVNQRASGSFDVTAGGNDG